MEKGITAGIIVTDGWHFLMCHPNKGRWWDIPKGRVETGESYIQAAIRELQEETSLVAVEEDLEFLGLFDYKPNKDLAIYMWAVDKMPDVKKLICTSTFHSNGGNYPEMDSFMIVDRVGFLYNINKSLQKICSTII
jgi:putative (di)nucleoside polyphosphate hydrolase